MLKPDGEASFMEPVDRRLDHPDPLPGDAGEGEARPGEAESGLEAENAELRKRLNGVLEAAAENERIWRHFTEIERILFRTRDLNQLVEELLLEIKDRFEPDQVTLLLCHQDLIQEYFPALSGDSEPIGDGTWIVPCPAAVGVFVCRDPHKPALLSGEELRKLGEYLPDSPEPVQSGVLIPLCVHEVHFGFLFLGSLDAERYRPDDGTDLLEQLGIKIALCMENCLTYEKVKDFSIQDPVTGLLNFFQIHTVLEREFRRARRLEEPLSVLIIDLDFFQDEEGRLDIGGRILTHVANLLKATLPQGEAFLGRFGSDEFLAVLPRVPGEEAREGIPYLAQTIRKSPFKLENAAILIHAHIGVGSMQEHTRRPQELLDAAYAELCQAKLQRRTVGGRPTADRETG